MNKTTWIQREIEASKKLGLNGHECAIKKMAEAGHYGLHHYYIPGKLNLKMLLKMADKIGILLQDYPDYNGRRLNTKTGVLECNLEEIMAPWPSFFNRGHDKQVELVIEKGGSGLTSVEETVYLLLRMFLKFDKILFETETGHVRCCNSHNRGGKSVVSFNSVTGLGVGWNRDDDRFSRLGVISRRFIPLVP